jgi:membrane protein YqaA with SNARE-associated domain
MLIASAPIILIEVVVVRRFLSVPRGKAFKGVVIANLFSTCVGVPVSWFLSFVITAWAEGPIRGHVQQAITWQPNGSALERVTTVLLYSGWIPPYGDPLAWYIAGAVLVLLVPCFFASVLLERWASSKIWRDQDRFALRRAVFRANLASYGFLFILGCLWLIQSSIWSR